MARGPRDTHATSVLVVEDNVVFHETIARGMAAVHDAPEWPSLRPSASAHDRAVRAACDREVDVVLLDALRSDGDRAANARLSRFAGLEVAHELASRGWTGRLVGYSAWATHPAINIGFRELPIVDAVYDSSVLATHVAEALWSEEAPHAVPRPTEEDFASLNLRPGARPWEALRVTMAHPTAWEAVLGYRSIARLDSNTRDWINDHLGDLLPLDLPRKQRWRQYAEILNQLAWIT